VRCLHRGKSRRVAVPSTLGKVKACEQGQGDQQRQRMTAGERESMMHVARAVRCGRGKDGTPLTSLSREVLMYFRELRPRNETRTAHDVVAASHDRKEVWGPCPSATDDVRAGTRATNDESVPPGTLRGRFNYLLSLAFTCCLGVASSSPTQGRRWSPVRARH
jgi:hypothetical protein